MPGSLASLQQPPPCSSFSVAFDCLINLLSGFFGWSWSSSFPGGSDCKASTCNAGDLGFIPGLGRSLERQWKPTLVFLLGKSHGWRNLVGYSPWGRKESDTTEQLHFHFSLSCIGEGNGNPLQCSCLENPKDGGAWWVAVYGVAENWTRLK